MRNTLLDVRPLRVPAFRRFWLGSAVASLGGAVGDFAVLLYVWEVTGSLAWTGTVALVRAVPSVIAALVGGPLADARDRRAILTVSVVGQLVLTAALALMVAADGSWLLPVMGVLGLRSAAASMAAPARQSVIPAVLSPAQLAAGLALLHMMFQVSLLLGPAAAGLLVSQVGLAGCLALDAVSFLGALYGVRGLPPKLSPRPDRSEQAGQSGRPAPRRPWRTLAQGFEFVLRSPVIRASMLVDLAATVLAMPVALFPAINDERFGGSPATLGLLLPAVGVGGLIASVLSGRVTAASRPGVVMLGGALLWAFGLTGFALAPSLLVGLMALCLAGVGDVVSVVARGTLVQLATPDHLRGRVNSIDYVVGALAPDLGNFRGGLVGEALGVRAAFLIGGLSSGVCIAAVGACSRELRRYRITSGNDDAPSTGDGASSLP